MKVYLLVHIIMMLSVAGYCQASDSPMHLQSDSGVMRSRPDFNIGLGTYFQLLKGNFIQQSISPFQLKPANLAKLGVAVAVTGGIMRFDKSIDHAAVKLRSNSSVLRDLGPQVTKFGGRYALFTMVGIGTISYAISNHQLRDATLLATQSYLTSGLWVSVLKYVSGRERPSYYNPQTGVNEGAWHGPLFKYKKDASGTRPDGARFSSFTSGHAAAAFSIATTYALYYKDRPWVAAVCYPAASLIALSRISESRHWASDVVVSAALGYACGRQVVKNFRKIERLHRMGQQKTSLVLNINYFNGVLIPGLVYTF